MFSTSFSIWDGGNSKKARRYAQKRRYLSKNQRYYEKKGIHRDWMQCRTKFKHMKSEYKKFKDNLSRSGAGRGKEPKFFQIMDGFLGDRPEAEGLKNSIDTSPGDAACSSAGAKISETASVDGLGKLFWCGGGGFCAEFFLEF